MSETLNLLKYTILFTIILVGTLWLIAEKILAPKLEKRRDRE